MYSFLINSACKQHTQCYTGDAVEAHYYVTMLAKVGQMNELHDDGYRLGTFQPQRPYSAEDTEDEGKDDGIHWTTFTLIFSCERPWRSKCLEFVPILVLYFVP